MQTIAVWNTAAWLRLNNHNPNWVRDLACDIPEANWKHGNISNDPALNACHPRTETGLKKFKKLPLDSRSISYILSTTVKNYSSQQNPAHTWPNLKSSWLTHSLEEWAYTDGSCQIHQGQQVTGAGTYHPATSTPSFVEPNSMGITNTINRAELAAITATILHGHSHIATDSLSSLH